MAHDHHHGHADSSNVGFAFFLNLGFTIVEIIGGFFTNSFAILADAIHDLGDTLSLGLAWYFQRLSKRGRTSQFTYGYRRFNTLGAIVTGVVLVGGSVFILTEAIPKLWEPNEVDASGMIWLAILGVVVNGAAVFKLRAGGDSLNEQVLTWHLLEDVLGWVAVLIGATVMYFYDLPWIDPALSIAIAAFVLFNVVKRLWAAGKIILMAAPEGVEHDQVLEAINALDGVTDAHHLHLWTLDGEYFLGSVHLVLPDEATVAAAEDTKGRVRRLTHDDFGIEHMTIETETAGRREEHGVGEV